MGEKEHKRGMFSHSLIILTTIFPIPSLAILLVFNPPLNGGQDLLNLILTPIALIGMSFVTTDTLRRGLKRTGDLMSVKAYLRLYTGISLILGCVFPVLFLLSSAMNFGKLYYYIDILAALTFLLFLAKVPLTDAEYMFQEEEL